MNNNLYPIIFKRKSFHLFRNIGDISITEEELEEIKKDFSKLSPLVDDIEVKIRIIKDSTLCKRGQEYCILFYSQKKENYLQNIGFLGEQLDLILVSKNIGTLWFGIGKPKEKLYEGLDFVITMAISKVDSESKFRKNMFKSKRKEVSEMWNGEFYPNIANIVQFAPSACNLQPWFVEASTNHLLVYRYTQTRKRGIMPKDKVIFYNQIDVGIFLCFLELCLLNEKLDFRRTIFTDTQTNQEKTLIADYQLNHNLTSNERT